MLLPSDGGRTYVLFLATIGAVGFLFGSMCVLHLDMVCSGLFPAPCIERQQALCVLSLMDQQRGVNGTAANWCDEETMAALKTKVFYILDG